MRQALAEAPGHQVLDRAAELERARAALAELTPTVARLVQTSAEVGARAVGEWSVLDVARHVSHVAAGELFVARTIGDELSEGFPIGDDLVAGVAGFNAGNIATDEEKDPSAIAARIEKTVSEFLDVMAVVRGDEPVAWLNGMQLPCSCLAAHLVGELVIHGFDLARAEGREFPIRAEDAALGFGFFLDILRYCPRSMRSYYVEQSRGARLQACIDLRLRGGRRDFLVFEGGEVHVEESPPRSVDCHVSADPTVAYLAGFGRISTARAVASGRMVAWGRRPWLAFKLPGLIRNP